MGDNVRPYIRQENRRAEIAQPSDGQASGGTALHKRYQLEKEMLVGLRGLSGAVIAVCLVSPVVAADPPVKAAPSEALLPFFSVNDNRITYAYLPEGTTPGVPTTFASQVYAFTHFDAWKYGTNFLNIVGYKSDHGNPANPCPVYGTGCAGTTFVAGTWRSTIGFNEVFETKAFTWGMLHGISLEFGAGATNSNSFVASGTRIGVIGLQFAFDLPYKGYFNVAPLLHFEQGHIAYLSPAFSGPLGVPDGNLRYDPTWEIETNYYMDLGVLPEYLPLSISGRVSWVGPKGRGTGSNVLPNYVPTKIELNAEPIRLTWDASKNFWGARYSHFLDIWVAYRYAQNELGLDHALSPFCTKIGPGSCTMSSVYTGVTAKF